MSKSASELLRELEEALRVFQPGGGIEREKFWAAEEATVTLRNALPELRAVVEVTEEVEHDHVRAGLETNWCIFCERWPRRSRAGLHDLHNPCCPRRPTRETGAGVTPDDLRALADAATTRGLERAMRWTTLDDARLIALAPDLARLVAEIGEALEVVLANEEYDDDPWVLRGRTALAKLAELEAR